jgi:hypothetical protein
LERRRGNAQIGVAVNDFDNNITKFVTRARVSYLLGIPQQELRSHLGSCGARWKRRRDVLHLRRNAADLSVRVFGAVETRYAINLSPSAVGINICSNTSIGEWMMRADQAMYSQKARRLSRSPEASPLLQTV